MIFIYSGDVPELNLLLKEKLGPDASLTTIPYAARETWSARDAALYFRQAGIRARSLSSSYYRNINRLEKILDKSQALFLCGGNTYEFLAYAREVGLFALLSRFEERGGVIVAESAGSIILSPDISTAGIPSSDPDPNTVKLRQLQAMGRLSFHVSPHFDPLAASAGHDREELQQLADVSGREVVVLQDGEGFVMDAGQIVHSVGKPETLVPEQGLGSVVSAHLEDNIHADTFRA